MSRIQAFEDELSSDASADKLAMSLARGRAIATILSDLDVDSEICGAARLYPLVQDGFASRQRCRKAFGEDLTGLVREMLRIGNFGFPDNWNPETGLDANQADVLRKMLFAIVADVRLVLVRLADQLDYLRRAKNLAENERRRAALETREIFAPLANRLGIWQLKWELEDLAFRYLQPDTYQQIAGLLAERRSDREAYIARVVATLKKLLLEVGVKAEVEGRPKHIWSIWRKMQRKQVGFEHVFDVRAVRILVSSVADCYTALGIVHGNWTYIPGEFDDYIATPKDNDYRSLHTAVVGPEHKTLEVQIRSKDMHEHAELGVAAHWKYKEGGRDDPGYQRKINWLRGLLEPSEPEETGTDFIDRFRSEIFEDRVYVLTPTGDIRDLPGGSTPLDFAYYLHTDIGHRCRGAKIGGRIVPLTYKLKNGEQVEIINGPRPSPSRDWLIPQLGYLASSRARAKVRVWFRRQDQEHNLEQGQSLYEREVGRLGSAPHVTAVGRELGYNSATELYVALGSGDITTSDLAAAIERKQAPTRPPPPPVGRGRAAKRRRDVATGTGIEVEGIGDLMSSLSKCCRPLPPDEIAGYITQGRGVSIHRSDCKNLLRLADQTPERLLDVGWASALAHRFPVDVAIEAFDRPGLLKDLSALLAADKVNIGGINTRTDRSSNTAYIDVTIEVAGLDDLSAVLHRLQKLPNVTSVRRKV